MSAYLYEDPRTGKNAMSFEDIIHEAYSRSQSTDEESNTMKPRVDSCYESGIEQLLRGDRVYCMQVDAMDRSMQSFVAGNFSEVEKIMSLEEKYGDKIAGQIDPEVMNLLQTDDEASNQAENDLLEDDFVSKANAGDENIEDVYRKLFDLQEISPDVTFREFMPEDDGTVPEQQLHIMAKMDQFLSPPERPLVKVTSNIAPPGLTPDAIIAENFDEIQRLKQGKVLGKKRDTMRSMLKKVMNFKINVNKSSKTSESPGSAEKKANNEKGDGMLSIPKSKLHDTPSSTSTSQPKSHDMPSTSQPMSYDMPSNSQPRSYDTPSTSQPRSYDTPSNSQPRSYNTPSTSQPKSHDMPSNSKPRSYDMPSNSQPWSYDTPSTSQPWSYDTPSTSQPMSYDTPSTSQPKSHDMPSSTSTSQPRSYDMPSTSQPRSYDMPSTSQPMSYDMPSTSQPWSYDTPSTSQPKLHDTPSSTSTSQPRSYDMPSTSQPRSHDMPSTSQPMSYDMPSTSQPWSYDTPSNSQPRSYDMPSTSQPMSYDTPSTSQPMSYDMQTIPQSSSYDILVTSQSRSYDILSSSNTSQSRSCDMQTIPQSASYDTSGIPSPPPWKPCDPPSTPHSRSYDTSGIPSPPPWKPRDPPSTPQSRSYDTSGIPNPPQSMPTRYEEEYEDDDSVVSSGGKSESSGNYNYYYDDRDGDQAMFTKSSVISAYQEDYLNEEDNYEKVYISDKTLNYDLDAYAASQTSNTENNPKVIEDNKLRFKNAIYCNGNGGFFNCMMDQKKPRKPIFYKSDKSETPSQSSRYIAKSRNETPQERKERKRINGELKQIARENRRLFKTLYKEELASRKAQNASSQPSSVNYA